MSRIHIVDYGMGNLDSVFRAVEECSGEPVWVASGEMLKGAHKIILPGVGAFGDGMAELEARNFPIALHEAANRGVQVLGICLGMQVLAEEGEEGGLRKGLGLIPGRVIRLTPNENERIPHVGWNDVHLEREAPLFAGIASGSDFYFVHSYHFTCANAEDVLATTPYCGGFTSAVARGSVAGVQFHPEKSQKTGLKLLRNFVCS